MLLAKKITTAKRDNKSMMARQRKNNSAERNGHSVRPNHVRIIPILYILHVILRYSTTHGMRGKDIKFSKLREKRRVLKRKKENSNDNGKLIWFGDSITPQPAPLEQSQFWIEAPSPHRPQNNGNNLSNDYAGWIPLQGSSSPVLSILSPSQSSSFSPSEPLSDPPTESPTEGPSVKSSTHPSVRPTIMVSAHVRFSVFRS